MDPAAEELELFWSEDKDQPPPPPPAGRSPCVERARSGTQTDESAGNVDWTNYNLGKAFNVLQAGGINTRINTARKLHVRLWHLSRSQTQAADPSCGWRGQQGVLEVNLPDHRPGCANMLGMPHVDKTWSQKHRQQSTQPGSMRPSKSIYSAS